MPHKLWLGFVKNLAKMTEKYANSFKNVYLKVYAQIMINNNNLINQAEGALPCSKKEGSLHTGGVNL